MELFLLIAIGLSLISFISVALTESPQQTFSPDKFMDELELTEEQPEIAACFDEAPGPSAEEPVREGSSGFLRAEDMVASQAI